MFLNFFESLSGVEADIIAFIQNIRNPFFDEFFKIITFLGDQYAFIVLVAVIYWLFDKKFAHKFAMGFIASSVVTGVVKAGVSRTRPYELYPDKVDLVGNKEISKSFPSGHSTSTGSISTALFMGYNKKFKWLKWVLLAYFILIPLSRLYLGVHYPTDVLTGLLIGVLVTFITFKVVDLMKDKEHLYSLILIPLFLIVILVSEIWLKDQMGYGSLHDIYIAAGGFVGFLGGYYLEKKYVNYDVKTKPLFQVLKVVIGLGIAVGIQQGLGYLFDKIQEDNLLLDFVRYFLIGVWAAVLAPLLFKKIFPSNKEETSNEEPAV